MSVWRGLARSGMVPHMAETLTPKQTRELLGISERTLARYVENHLLTPVGRTLGGHARYDRADVVRLRESSHPRPSVTNAP